LFLFLFPRNLTRVLYLNGFEFEFKGKLRGEVLGK
jgi:hypothetical protein